MLRRSLIIISLVFNLVGLYLIVNKPYLYILQYSAIAICLVSVLVFAYEKDFDLKLLRTFSSISIFGFLIEVIGVNSGMPFGEYFYGDNLGPKIFSVPIVLSLNWLLLIYLSWNLASIFPLSKIKQAFLASILMVFIDLTIEPIAARLDFWYWLNQSAGALNYLSWLLISFFLILFLISRHELKTNYVALFHYFIYTGFFIILNFVL